MAKAKKKEPKEFYQYIDARVIHGKGIEMKYRITGRKMAGSDFLDDETCGTWPDDDVTKMVREYLNVQKDDPVKVEVMHD